MLCVLLCFSVATVTSSVDSSYWQGSLSSGSLFASKHLNVGRKQQSLSEYGSRFAGSGTRLMMAGSGMEVSRLSTTFLLFLFNSYFKELTHELFLF